MANAMRDRLVELVQDALFQHAHYVAKERRRALEAETEAEHSEIYENIKALHEFIADHLIENGVIVPPCKVGDTMYFDGKHFASHCAGQIMERRVDTVLTEVWSTFRGEVDVSFGFKDFGKTVFLTKDQAEQKLKEMRGGNGNHK